MNIDTVLFDMGGTIEDVSYDNETRINAAKRILKFLSDSSIFLETTVDEFVEILKKRFAEYKTWSLETCIEANPTVIWTKWLLQDFKIDEEKISSISEPLSVIWETNFYKRRCREEVPEMLEKLKQRGYKLGVISNTTSKTQVFSTLEEYKIRDYFSCVCLSSVTGIRKPNKEIFEEALQKVGSMPQNTVYVGDQIARDVVGSKAAGYALVILIESFFTTFTDESVRNDLDKIDYKVSNLMEIVELLDRIN